MGLLPKKVMNFAYGMGAAVVIVGALFEMTSIISVIAIFLIPLFLILLISINKLKVLKQFYFALLIFAVLITLLFTIYM